MLKLFKNYPQNYQSKIHPLMVVIPLSLYGLYKRFLFRATHDLWHDELHQARICSKPFFQFLKELPGYDYCKYLNGDYVLTYPFFQIFGMNKWGLAIPHVIITILGFYFLYQICKKQFKSVWAYAVTFGIFSFNATLIRHAFEIRPYSVLVTLSIAVYYFVSLLMKQQSNLSRFQKWAVGIFLVFTIWFHPYGLLIVFFISLYIWFSLSMEEGGDCGN